MILTKNGNKGVKGRRRLRKRMKFELIMHNMDFFNSVLKDYQYSEKPHLTKDGKKIIELWRTKIGYSKNTADIDVLMDARHTFKEIVTALNGHQRRRLC